MLVQMRELHGVEWLRIGDICTNPRLVKSGVGRHDVIQVGELCVIEEQQIGYICTNTRLVKKGVDSHDIIEVGEWWW